MVVTTKDFIILRLDGTKVYESEYLNTLKEASSRNEAYENMRLISHLLSFNLLASSCVFKHGTQ